MISINEMDGKKQNTCEYQYLMDGDYSLQSIAKDQIYTSKGRFFNQNTVEQGKKSTNRQEKSSIYSEITYYDKPTSNNLYTEQKILSLNNQSEQLLSHNQTIRKSQKQQSQINYKQNNSQIVIGNKTKIQSEYKSYPKNLINSKQKKSYNLMLELTDNSMIMLVHINDIIISKIEASQVHHSKLVHVIIPFGLALLEVFSLTKRKQTYAHKKFLQILKLLNNREIQDQINFNLFQTIYLFFAQYRYKTQEEVISMLFDFLSAQRSIMQAICPYYLNIFMMIVNKDFIFNSHNARFHINYTINFQHGRYNGNFVLQDVKREIENLEVALANAYNSTQI